MSDHGHRKSDKAGADKSTHKITQDHRAKSTGKNTRRWMPDVSAGQKITRSMREKHAPGSSENHVSTSLYKEVERDFRDRPQKINNPGAPIRTSGVIA